MKPFQEKSTSTVAEAVDHLRDQKAMAYATVVVVVPPPVYATVVVVVG